MRSTHNGVLLPHELEDATEAEKDEYAARVRRDNGAFVRAVFALEDEAERLGVELPS